jgi:hypothetical protein
LGKTTAVVELEEEVLPKKIVFSQDQDTVHKVPAPSSPVTVAKLLAPEIP